MVRDPVVSGSVLTDPVKGQSLGRVSTLTVLTGSERWEGPSHRKYDIREWPPALPFASPELPLYFLSRWSNWHLSQPSAIRMLYTRAWDHVTVDQNF